MEFPLIDIYDVKERAIHTTLIVPDEDGSTNVLVRFDVPFGAGGSHYLATVLNASATYANESEFVLTDGFDGTQDTYIPAHWIRTLAASAISALPRLVGTFEVLVQFVRDDPRIPF
jgi:hypothetical protein